MSEALEYIYYIFDSMFDWLFNDAELFENVTIGWVIIVVTVFGLLIRSLLNIPRSARTVNTNRLPRNQDD